MTNDSSTGGYLAPTGTPTPLEDQALLDFFQAIFAGITGIPGTLIRPRWQPTPPNQPSNGTNWMAFGITDRPADEFAYEYHNPAAAGGQGADIVERTEELTILCSFYGLNADSNAALLRDGLQVGQNREVLLKNGMALISAGGIVAAPAILNSQWYYKVDMSVRIRRAVVRTYPILNLESAVFSVEDDSGLTDTINVSN